MPAPTPTYPYVHLIEFNYNGKLYSFDFLSTSSIKDMPNARMMARGYLEGLSINFNGKIKIVSYTVMENK